ncbi:MAG: hypothetical protein HYY17_13180 [Planctomycetes bacterium]|nr:hypothetical protein [Planctomycetota bacterium]
MGKVDSITKLLWCTLTASLAACSHPKTISEPHQEKSDEEGLKILREIAKRIDAKNRQIEELQRQGKKNLENNHPKFAFSFDEDWAFATQGIRIMAKTGHRPTEQEFQKAQLAAQYVREDLIHKIVQIHTALFADIAKVIDGK